MQFYHWRDSLLKPYTSSSSHFSEVLRHCYTVAKPLSHRPLQDDNAAFTRKCCWKQSCLCSPFDSRCNPGETAVSDKEQEAEKQTDCRQTCKQSTHEQVQLLSVAPRPFFSHCLPADLVRATGLTVSRTFSPSVQGSQNVRAEASSSVGTFPLPCRSFPFLLHSKMETGTFRSWGQKALFPQLGY